MKDLQSTADERMAPSALERIDGICERFEDAWQSGQRPCIEGYLGQVARPERERLLQELIALDIDYRRQQGEKPEPREYQERFPSLPGSWLERLVGASRYELAAEIGIGGMGTVLQGYDRHLRRDLAVKMLRPEYRDQPYLVRRFLREAWIGARLQHPGIVPVYELGEFPDRQPYFTMKLVRGRTLEALLKERANPGADLPRFLAIFEQVCQTVGYAHAQGILHRDLKPANIMVGEFGEVQVMDWGLAKVLDWARGAGRSPLASQDAGSGGPVGGSTDQGMETQPGHAMGTFPYMPPEQARGEMDRLDERSDVFGLGAILCELLTGQPPFSGTDKKELIEKVKACDHAEARTRLDVCGADAELLHLAKTCLEAKPEDRPRNAGVVAEQVQAYLAGVQQRLQAAERERAAAQARAEEAKKTVVAERRARWRAVWLAAAVLLLGLGGGGGGLWWRWQHVQREQAVDRDEGEINDALAKGDMARAKTALAQAEARVVESSSTALMARVRQMHDKLHLAERLDKIRLEGWAWVGESFDSDSVDRSYAELFEEQGIARNGETAEEVAARIRNSPLKTQLVAALDDWALAARDGGRQAWILEIARRVDPGEWTDRLRDPAVWQDAAALRRLASQPQVAQLPTSVLSALVRVLEARRVDAMPLLIAAEIQAPRDFWLNFALARMLSWTKPDEAAGYYRAALAARPNTGVVYANLSAVLVNTERWDETIAAAQKAIELDPTLAGAYTNLGVALTNKGRLEEGLAACRKAVELDSTKPRFHNNLSIALRRNGRPDKALAAAGEAIKLDARLAQAYVSRGNAQRDKGLLDQAVASYQEAIAKDASDAKAYNNLGAVLSIKGRTEEALAAFRRAIQIDDRYANAYFNLGDELRKKGLVDEAIVAYRKVVALNPVDAEAHHDLGLALAAKEQLNDAIAAYQEAIKLAPTLATAHYNLGNALMASRRFDQAIEAYKRALELDPRDERAYTNLGITLTEQRRFDQAIECFCEAIKFNPMLDKARFNLGRTLQARDDTDAAIDAYRKTLKLNSSHVNAHYNLGIMLAKKGLLDDALVAFQNTLKLNPKHAGAYNHLGLALAGKKQHDQAIAAYREAIKIDRRFAQAYRNLGTELRLKGQTKDAIEACRRAVALDPKNARAHFSLGRAFVDGGQIEDAINEYRESIELDPDDATSHSNLGDLLRSKGELDEALTECRTAVNLAPTDAPSQHNLGTVLATMKRFPEAAEAFRLAIRYGPELSKPHSNLAAVLILQGHLDEAIEESRTAIRIEPMEAAGHYQLGLALARKGRLDEAIPAFEKAIECNRRFVQAYSSLGRALLQSGQFAEARKTIRRGLQLLPENSPARVLFTRQLQECEQLLALEKKLTAVLGNETQPSDGRECLSLAWLCREYKKRHVAAARLYADAFAAEPGLAADLIAQHRYGAACSAALAAAGQGEDACHLPDKVVAMLRRQALGWLRDDLAAYSKSVERNNATVKRAIEQRLTQWQRGPELASLREKDALDKLSEEERDACHKLWADVADLLQRAEGK